MYHYVSAFDNTVIHGDTIQNDDDDDDDDDE